jgi:DNA polymerase-3 subunit alpha
MTPGRRSVFYQDVFDAVFVEIQDHPGCDEQFRSLLDVANPKLVRLARRAASSSVATNDAYYTAPEDHEAHDILLCIGSNATVQDSKRLRLEGGRTTSSPRRRCCASSPSCRARQATAEVAALPRRGAGVRAIAMPGIDLPPGVTTDEHLANLCYEGRSVATAG